MLYQEKSCSIGEACCQDITGHMVFDLTKLPLCYIIAITGITKDGESMILRIDFNSDEALYIQLRNQIIMGIATGELREGDALPSVRQLADHISINMHTVNKAYALLRQEGYIRLDRRTGAVIAVDADKIKAMEEMKRELLMTLAKGSCRNITREEVHQLIDEIYEEYGE